MVRSRLSVALVLAAPLALGACASDGMAPGTASVTRFHSSATPAPGTRITVAPAPGGMVGELEFSTYAGVIAQAAQRAGFVPAAGAPVVLVADVQRGRRQSAGKRSPFSIGLGTGSFGRHTGVGLGTSVGIGGTKPGTLVTTALTLQLKRQADGVTLWEGRAETEAATDRAEASPAVAVSLLADALFRDYPGPSGQTILVKPETR